MTNAPSPAPAPASPWPLWASIIALVLALFGLCTGFFVPWASLLCPLIAVVLAALALKSKRKALPIVALVFSIVSFCVVGGVGALFWTDPQYQPRMAELYSAFGALFQSIVQLVKSWLKIP
jgi:hypothetical protein